jgi:hypothetical protein
MDFENPAERDDSKEEGIGIYSFRMGYPNLKGVFYLKKTLLVTFFTLLLIACGNEKTFDYTVHDFIQKYEETAGDSIPIGEKIQFDEKTYLVEILPTVALVLNTDDHNNLEKAAVSVKPEAISKDMDIVLASFHTLLKSIDPSLTDDDIDQIYNQLDIAGPTLANHEKSYTLNHINYKIEKDIESDSILLEASPD